MGNGGTYRANVLVSKVSCKMTNKLHGAFTVTIGWEVQTKLVTKLTNKIQVSNVIPVIERGVSGQYESVYMTTIILHSSMCPTTVLSP